MQLLLAEVIDTSPLRRVHTLFLRKAYHMFRTICRRLDGINSDSAATLRSSSTVTYFYHSLLKPTLQL